MCLVGKGPCTGVVASSMDWVVSDATVALLCVRAEAALGFIGVLATDW